MSCICNLSGASVQFYLWMNGQMPKQTDKDGSLKILGMDDNIVLRVSAHTGKPKGTLREIFFLTLDQEAAATSDLGFFTHRACHTGVGFFPHFHLQPLLCVVPFLPVGSYRYLSQPLKNPLALKLSPVNFLRCHLLLFSGLLFLINGSSPLMLEVLWLLNFPF